MSALVARVSNAVRWFRRHWLAISLTAGAVLGVGSGYLVGEGRLAPERETTLANIEKYRAVLTDAVAKSKARPELDARLQELADQTLGSTLEAVDSEFRRRLNRACEQLGLTDFSVTTGTSVGRPTPAKKEFKSREGAKLRDEVDFVEVEATVIASGTLERIYNLIFRIDAEPWIKRIASVRLNPSGDGQIIRATIKLSTPFMPGRSPSKERTVSPERLKEASRYAVLFASNPFRIPPAPTPTQPPVVVATNPPAQGVTESPIPNTEVPPSVPDLPGGFPYGEWQLTGVVEGPSGAEVWLRHVPSGASLALQPGSAVGELVFRRAEYDGSAVFDSPVGTCRVQVGTNLTQRAPVSSS